MTSKKNLYSLALKEEMLPGGFTEYRAEIEWRDGMPYLVSAPIRLSEAPENALRVLLRKCLDLPYDGTDPTLRGLSQGEAMMVNLSRDAAMGMPGARELILDRLLGKPQQNIKSVQLSGDLNDFLDKVARETKIETVEITPDPPMDPYLDAEDL